MIEIFKQNKSKPRKSKLTCSVSLNKLIMTLVRFVEIKVENGLMLFFI